MLAGLILWPRLQLLGHPLFWDEAWNINALRSLTAGSDLFSQQYWRHPPLYMELGRLLGPNTAGFDQRLQLLSILLNTLGLLAFLHPVARIYGRKVAVYTGVVYAFLPGAIFFDTWIKQDPAVTCFGMLAIGFLIRRKFFISGLLLGLAFLGKATAIFYLAGSILYIFSTPNRPKAFRLVLLLAGSAMLVCGWWYATMSTSGSGFLSFFAGTSIEANEFSEPWYFYFEILPVYADWLIFFFFFPGLLVCFPQTAFIKQKNRLHLQRYLGKRALPLFFLLPAFGVLSLSQGKPPWMMIILHPFLALLAGMGCHLLVGRLVTPFLNRLCRFPENHVSIHHAMVFSLTSLLTLQTLPTDYSALANRLTPTQHELAKISYKLAEAVNQFTRPGETLLVLPMRYRQGPFMPDPIFYWHMSTNLKIIRDLTPSLEYTTFKNLIAEKRVAWVLMSPTPSSDQEEILRRVFLEFNPPGLFLQQAVLLNTSSFWHKEIPSPDFPTQDPRDR